MLAVQTNGIGVASEAEYWSTARSGGARGLGTTAEGTANKIIAVVIGAGVLAAITAKIAYDAGVERGRSLQRSAQRMRRAFR